MVWFQCEDCGDNLKKPKLANHFRSCSATKLSCIDCGQMFGQQTVQSHTQSLKCKRSQIQFLLGANSPKVEMLTFGKRRVLLDLSLLAGYPRNAASGTR